MFILIILTIINLFVARYIYKTHKATKELYSTIGFEEISKEDQKLFTDFYKN